MIDVLLIEDNELALEYITKIIDWRRHGFRIVATASDGEEGLKSFFVFRPKLIITDIQMPVISGVEFAKRVRAVDKSVRIIFLSSYQEFSYAKSALDLEVSYYLLKHELDEHTLLGKLNEVKAGINERLIVSRLKLENDIFESVLGNLPVKPERKNDATPYAFIALEREQPLKTVRNLVSLPGIDLQQVRNVCYGLGEKVAGVVNKGELFFLLCVLDNEPVNLFAYELKGVLEAQFGCGFSILVIEENILFIDCRQRYLICKDMIHRSFFSTRSAVLNSIFFEDFKAPIVNHFDARMFEQAIDGKNVEEIIKIIDTCFYDIIKLRDYPGLLALSDKLMGILRTYGGVENSGTEHKFELLGDDDLKLWYTAKGIAEFYRTRFADLIDFLTDKVNRQYSTAVKQAMRFISDNYTDVNLSVEDIAKNTGLGANRLGIVFKRETGRSIREFLNEHRVEESKRLIERGLRMGEIHKMVGYLTVQYFCKVFQKVTGVTPTDYKKECAMKC